VRLQARRPKIGPTGFTSGPEPGRSADHQRPQPELAELVDATDSKSVDFGHLGSSPRFGTLVRGDDMPDEAVLLFLTFVRFEQALKNHGYLQGNPNDEARPNWDVFANDLGPAFFQAQQASADATIFFNAPPAKQIVGQNGMLDWAQPDPPTTSQELLVAVRRVRNNLHHGAKMVPTQRDYELIQAARKVLDAARAHAAQQAGKLKDVADVLPSPVWG
jgi:hypothetical protein